MTLPPEVRETLAATLPDPARTDAPTGTEVLKSARQRLVLRMRVDLPDRDSVIAKLFPLKNPSSMLRYKKYAYREYLNTGRAQALGIPSPEPLAYVERRRFGLVIGSGLLLEDLTGHTDILRLASDIDGGYMASAMLAIPLFCKLFDTGVNHIDARDENLMIPKAATDGGAIRLIDWQYARFVAPRADWLLEYLCAYFIRLAPALEQAGLRAVWARALHDASGSVTEWDRFRRRVDKILEQKRSTRMRLNLTPIS